MVSRLINGPPRNFPTQPQISGNTSERVLTYPSDLFAPTVNGESNKFFVNIGIKTAKTFFGFGGQRPTGPIINLPIPRKINDVQVLTWSQESTTALAASLGVNLLNFGGGVTNSGIIINPALFLLFKHPNFKSFEMSWTFVADNEQESITIRNIIDRLKYHSSPERGNTNTGGVLSGVLGPLYMNYPDVFYIRINPEPKFTFRIKPCIIEAIAADYSGGDVPAFYKNGAPVAINLTIRFKEIEIWEKSTWNENTQ